MSQKTLLHLFIYFNDSNFLQGRQGQPPRICTLKTLLKLLGYFLLEKLQMKMYHFIANLKKETNLMNVFIKHLLEKYCKLKRIEVFWI